MYGTQTYTSIQCGPVQRTQQRHDALLLLSSLTTLAPDEIGHNMGCYHDIANNGLDPPNDYSHGLRYCSGDVR